MDCLSGWVNKTIQKLYFASHIVVLGPLNGAKRANIWSNGGTKYKIDNFEANDAFEVL